MPTPQFVISTGAPFHQRQRDKLASQSIVALYLSCGACVKEKHQCKGEKGGREGEEGGGGREKGNRA